MNFKLTRNARGWWHLYEADGTEYLSRHIDVIYGILRRKGYGIDKNRIIWSAEEN